MDTAIGQLCLNKKTGEEYYFFGKKNIKGSLVNVFKKYTAKSGFLSGFWVFEKMSEFDESIKKLNKITIQHFEEELNKHPLFNK